ncbi:MULTISPECIES: hypothetical protein [Streptomyces]|uniref:Uncharacterized protein n=1 Tax=Streptomyces yangpuensis TaxID=1648182 RepID=A0ABY5PTT0_9ACTN|nr:MULTISPECIES: hypothetical protein [Streptomyces]MBZ9595157.1 hypothetical protein [Streptomyces erythrochromogenes]UUY47188.1 hypothetical protein NRK68_08135 [Streptomyces yangpuensis]
MSAPTHPRSLPPTRRVRTATTASTRLHWWALALPALAFGLLLLLLAGSGEAHAATGEVSGLVQVAQQLLRAVG